MTEYLIRLPGGRLMIPSLLTYYGQTERLLTFWDGQSDVLPTMLMEDNLRAAAGVPTSFPSDEAE